MYKIIGADGNEYGPVSAEQLRQWLAEGRINAQTKVRPEGATEWKLFSDLPEFAAAVPSGPPPTMAIIPASGSAAQEQVNGPAIGLIIVAILGFMLQAAALAFNIAGKSLLPATQMQNEAWVNMFSGAIGVVSNIIAILVSGLILFGGIQMRKLDSYGLAMTASIVALIPCISPCCVVGLPIGIWALVVLSKPEVKSAFH
jgi:hypothetical protein